MKKWLWLIISFLALYFSYGQSEFLQKSSQKICHQLQTDDILLLEVADSLYVFLDEQQDPKTIAYLHFWKALGYFHSSEQPLDSMVNYAAIAHEKFLRLNDSEGLFEAHSLLGKALLYVNDFRGANRHLSLAKQYADNNFKRFRNLVDYGHEYVFEDKIDSAFVVLYEAEKLLPFLNQQECGYEMYKTEMNINLGMSEIRRVDYENTDYVKSIKYFKRASASYDLSEHKGFENYLFCLINLSYCYRKSGFFGVKSIHLDSARVYLEDYIRLVEKSNIKGKYGKLDNAYANLGWQLHAEGKSNEGIYQVQRSRDYLDSMYSDLMNQKVIEITNSYENKLKDNKIEALNLSNQRARHRLFLVGAILLLCVLLAAVLSITYIKLKKKNKLLLEQKMEISTVKSQLEMLLREIHHRIKNNLQIISSFLGIQKRELSQLEAIDALSKSQHRIQTIALLHEQLYAKKGLEKVAIKPYVEELIVHCKENMTTQNEILFEIKIQNHILNFDTCLSVGIIINELIINSLKHAFEQKTNNIISVDFSKSHKHYHLIVADNGKGMPLEPKKETTGLGTQIIEAMTQKLGGTVSVTSKNGTHVAILIPI